MQMLPLKRQVGILKEKGRRGRWDTGVRGLIVQRMHD
jgi:hypothetical protein